MVDHRGSEHSMKFVDYWSNCPVPAFGWKKVVSQLSLVDSQLLHEASGLQTLFIPWHQEPNPVSNYGGLGLHSCHCPHGEDHKAKTDVFYFPLNAW